MTTVESVSVRARLRRELGLEHVSCYFGVLPGVLGLIVRADLLVVAGAALILMTAFLISSNKPRWFFWTLVSALVSTLAYAGAGHLLALGGYELPHSTETTLLLPAYGLVFGALVSKLEQGLGNLAVAADSIIPGGL